MSPIKYSVENLEYDGAFSVSLRDVEDDQVGGYKLRMRDLVEKSKSPFKNRLILQTLAAGKTTTCFDGSYFFATSHNIGGYAATIPGTSGNTGGNLLGFTATASSDALTHRFVMMVKTGMLNPVIYQNRKAPKFMTDAGTPHSSKAKKADYWIDLEAAAAFGYWWDAVMVEVTNTPSVLELIAAVDCARQALRRFELPKSLTTDPTEYPHEQLVINPKNVHVVCSVGLETLFDRVTTQHLLGVNQAGSSSGLNPNNAYVGKFGYTVSNYLN
jgi:phage major head subunit gpT-like protein